jgi:cytochrome b
MAELRSPASGAGTRLVWDAPVRITHWLLLASVIGSYATHRLGAAGFRYHRWCGYTTLVLVTARIGWGLVGTRHARFASFVRGPVAVSRYLASLIRGEPSRHAGHNPAGGWMVLLLLALLAAQGVTGLFANDEIADAGPLYGYVLNSTSNRLTAWHHRLFDALVIAIALHVAAVLAYWLVKRTNLLRPMFTGRKPAADVQAGAEIAGSRVWLWLALIGVASGALAWIVARAPEVSLFVF